MCAISYTSEAKFPLSEDGGYNWGAIINGVFEALDRGMELTFSAGENIAAGDVVALKSNGSVYKAKATDQALTPAIGIAPSAITSGQEGKVRGFGYIDVDTSYSCGASVSWSPGDPAYVGTVAGRLSKTRTSWSGPIGWCKQVTDGSFDTRFFLAPAHRRSEMFLDAKFQNGATFWREVAIGASGAAKTIDWTQGNKQAVILSADCEFTFTAPAGPCNLVLRLVQDGTGSRLVTWPGSVKWPAGTAPTLTTTTWAEDLVCFYYNGISYYGGSILAFA